MRTEGKSSSLAQSASFRTSIKASTSSFSKIVADLQGADKTNKNGQNMKVGYNLTTGEPQ